MNVCIKGIKPEDWRYLKAEAVKADRNLGDYINYLIMKEREKSISNWEIISSWKPTLTPKESEEMLSKINVAFNKETEFR
jgi:hypothetical protein